jgi:hypothetical protein
MPADSSFPMEIGSSGWIYWQIPFDPAGYHFTWRFKYKSMSLDFDTRDQTLFVNVSDKLLAWPYSTLHSRMFPAGNLTQNEVQSISPDGSQTVEALGLVNGIGGLNDD